MELHESGEMYLETILVLKNRLGLVRSIDIANEMGFSKPTISVAMKKYREDGLVSMDDQGFINLTEEGRDIAEKIYERHQVISHVLMALGVSKNTRPRTPVRWSMISVMKVLRRSKSI